MNASNKSLLTVPLKPSPPTLTEDECHAAMRRRDRALDGRFVYAVRTTGVYCRPSCAARPARRENVSFYPTGEAAARAGFRPCKRCRPNEPSQAARHADAVRRVCRLIQRADTTPTLASLAGAVGLSPCHFHRIFRRVTGVTPKAYASAHRANRLADELLRGAPTVGRAIFDAGYNAASRGYAHAGARLGMSPSAYRRRGAGTEIRFAVGQCSLGALLVAATRTGVCAILLGDDPEALVRDLQDRFTQADLRGGDTDFEQLVARVVGLVEAPGQGLDLPLDVGGTAFQQRVWEALRRIPPGQTASYAQIAADLGAPGASRAVARACAANPLAVAIPCHRVVRSDGSRSGYRWGVERKRVLLEREQSAGGQGPWTEKG